MKYSLLYLPVCILIILASANITNGQQRLDSDPHKHNHDIYKEIEQDYTKGRLNLDQKVLYKFYATGNPQKLPESYQLRASEPVKCGTPAVTDFQQNYEKLSASTVAEIESIMGATTQSSETFQSPSGKFEIHYETTGRHAVPPGDEDGNNIPDYVEDVAAAADSSYRHQVQTLGYTDPISNGQSYEIRIRNLQPFYGDTWPKAGTTTYIRIENDFAEDFPPNDHPEGNQIGAVNATVAHEFKHAIQYAANEWEGETGLWLEMDATLMEEIVYDDVNDYYNYIESDQSIFKNPQNSFYPGSYHHVTWALFFEEKYGTQFWPQVWELIKDNPNITMVEALTQQLGGSNTFQSAYTESQLWHYASGENGSPNFGFEESANYPTASFELNNFFYTENFSIPHSANTDSINGFAAKYYRLQNKTNTSGKVSLEFTVDNPTNGVGLIARKKTGDVDVYISQDKSNFTTLDISWDEVSSLGLVLSNSSTSDNKYGKIINIGVGDNNFETTLSQNYPNPFNPQTKIRFTLDQPGHVELRIYDSTGRLVTTLINEQLPAGLYEPVFDGSELASGIYFYQLITNNKSQTKQMTLVK